MSPSWTASADSGARRCWSASRTPQRCTGLSAGLLPTSTRWEPPPERWSQMALASARWESRGLHDSSGEIRDMMLDAPRGPIHAVARFAQQATGVDRVLAAGNCLGGRLGLFLAADMPGCIGAVCIIP